MQSHRKGTYPHIGANPLSHPYLARKLNPLGVVGSLGVKASMPSVQTAYDPE
jgi:hypothetical protein